MCAIEVPFVPFGKSMCLPVDVSRVARRIKANVDRVGGPHVTSFPSVCATVGAAAVLWNENWADILRIVPVPMNDFYMAELIGRILAARAGGVQLANTALHSSRAYSILTCAEDHVMKRAYALAGVVEKVSVQMAECSPSLLALSRAGGMKSLEEALAMPRFPADGYNMKFVQCVLDAMGFDTGTRGASGDTLRHMASGALGGLSRAANIPVKKLKADRSALARICLSEMDGWVRDQFNRKTSKPSSQVFKPQLNDVVFCTADLLTQLCGWRASGYSSEHVAIGRVMLACIA